MTDEQFNSLLRQALMEAAVLDMPPADSFTPGLRFRLRERRLLRDPFGTLRRHKRRAARPPVRRALQRAAAILLLAVTLGAITFGLLPAETRAAVWNWITDWGEKFAFFRYEISDGEEGAAEEMTYWRPTYVPEEFEEVEYLRLINQVIIKYLDQSGHSIRFSFTYLQNNTDIIVDSEHQLQSMITIGENKVSVITSLSPNYNHYVLWMDEENKIIFKISADYDVNVSELVKMMKNVKIDKSL